MDTAVARIVSAGLHPFLTPVYAVAVFMYGNTLMAYATPRLKFYYCAVVALVGCIIPALCIGLLRALRVIDDFAFNRRQDRTIPLLIVTLGYGICVFMVSKTTFGYVMRTFMLAAFSCSLATLIISLFWKISLHMVAAGGVSAMFVMLAVSGLGSVFNATVAAVLLSGVLGTARLQLGRHTPAQVGIGYIAGFIIAALAMLYVH